MSTPAPDQPGPVTGSRTRRDHPAAVTLAVLALLGGGCGQAGAVTETRQQLGSAPFVAETRPQLGSAPLVIGSEVARSVPNPSAVSEPRGYGPVSGIDMNRSRQRATTAVAHVVNQEIEARSSPDDTAPVVATFANPNARGGPTVFQVVGPTVDGWVEALLPVRPNGTSGWIRVDDVELTHNPYRIDIDVAGFVLKITRDREIIMTTTISIGTGETPTPLGDFYLTELLRPPDPAGIYGPYAYGLSGFSDTLSSFNGGPGIIGIHGTNQPELLGTNVSHGCVRVDNAVIEQMTTFLPLGTPVSIG